MRFVLTVTNQGGRSDDVRVLDVLHECFEVVDATTSWGEIRIYPYRLSSFQWEPLPKPMLANAYAAVEAHSSFSSLPANTTAASDSVFVDIGKLFDGDVVIITIFANVVCQPDSTQSYNTAILTSSSDNDRDNNNRDTTDFTIQQQATPTPTVVPTATPIPTPLPFIPPDLPDTGVAEEDQQP